MTHPDTSLNMVRDSMDQVPLYTLPPGYRFRAYQAGDDQTWKLLHQAAEPFIPITENFFDGQFGTDLDALPDRMFFVETNSGEVAGTITAWWEHGRHDPNARGRIHWVAVHPTHQRRGLTKPMMTHAMQRLAQEYAAVMLGTSSGRPWAIKVYLDFGFRPEPGELADPQIYAAWQHLQRLLQHPVLHVFAL